tara:strand:+ start:380 stop:889 length:510 start_codon:yes stop_codon:yes gene_type:complete
MPAHINYQTTPIIFYKFVCEDPEIQSCYVGHTTNFMNRRRSHKYNCININSSDHNFKIYQIIREHGGFENWKMVEIDRQICFDKSDACKIEQKYIEALQSNMNVKNAYLDIQHRTAYLKQYRLDNIEKIATRSAQKFDCECGGNFTCGNKSFHFKTLKHLKYCEINLPF